jgi:hypothetical protein
LEEVEDDSKALSGVRGERDSGDEEGVGDGPGLEHTEFRLLVIRVEMAVQVSNSFGSLVGQSERTRILSVFVRKLDIKRTVDSMSSIRVSSPNAWRNAENVLLTSRAY